jgi:hypothetical protein
MNVGTVRVPLKILTPERVVSSENNRIVTWERNEEYIAIRRILTSDGVADEKRFRCLRLTRREFRALVADFNMKESTSLEE